MGTQELQVIEFEIKELVPAQIKSNAEELKSFMLAVKEKYNGWIVTEDEIDIAKAERTKLNKLEKKISTERKRIQKEANADIEILIENLKSYEKEVREISNFIAGQLETFEDQQWENKKEEIKKIINRNSIKKEDLKEFLVHNEKWKNKTFSFNKIEAEIMEQFEALEIKKNFITSEIEKANSEINFKIIFENMKFLMNEDYDVIIQKIETEKNKIKQTEENLRIKAEEDKQKALAELEAKKEQEKQEAIQQTQKTYMDPPVQPKATKNEKYFDTTIRFPRASLSFLKELKRVSEIYGIKSELIENIELGDE